jgi:heme/copper-type cytochrome/quinol oxidase subunit 1
MNHAIRNVCAMPVKWIYVFIAGNITGIKLLSLTRRLALKTVQFSSNHFHLIISVVILQQDRDGIQCYGSSDPP